MDFDHTLTTKDSFMHFLEYRIGTPSYYIMLGLLSPWIILYFMGLVKALELKRRFMSFIFKGKDVNEVNKATEEYTRSQLSTILNSRAINMLLQHHSRGDQVVIVSASPDIFISYFANHHKVELIATKVEVVNGVLTGGFEGLNCKGHEKVRRIKERFDLDSFDEIIAYGNLPEDGPMLDLAHHKYADSFK